MKTLILFLLYGLLFPRDGIVFRSTLALDTDEDENYDDILSEMAEERDAFESIPESSMGLSADAFATDQEVDGTDEEIAATNEVIRLMTEYLDAEVSKSKYNKVRYLCVNKDPLCAFWASLGECTVNENFMSDNCPLACRNCHLLLEDEL